MKYERNWEAQERASKGHIRLIRLLVSAIKNHGITALESNIDMLAVKRNALFIFEAKTIHESNFVRQTRQAIGQLLEYEYFDITSKAEFRGRRVMRGIVYNREPPQHIIEFLRAFDFNVYWSRGNKLIGKKDSFALLNRFLRS